MGDARSRQPNPEIADLMPAVYEELRRLASSYLRRERDANELGDPR